VVKKIWITYAWGDNQDQNIDFLIQELDSKPEIEVKFDRKNLIPGQRLWPQIGGLITDPKECDAWGIILTKNSITSEACIEELCYALDRALNLNGDNFPVFALLHNVAISELPPGLKIRLCISLEDDNWSNLVVAAAYKKTPELSKTDLFPYVLKNHKVEDGFCLEIRPRFERIAPFAVAVDYNEKISGNVTSCSPGPAGKVPTGHVAASYINSETNLTDGTHVTYGAGAQIMKQALFIAITYFIRICHHEFGLVISKK